MFGFIEKCFYRFFGCNILSVNPLKFVSMNNQECNVRPKIININSNESSSGTWNNINDPYAKLCVSHVVKNINVKVFNLVPRPNETRHMKWHETCKCKCRLDANVGNNKPNCNNDKWRCECKELMAKKYVEKGFIWNPSTCDCKCDKLCDVGEYLDYRNCKCRNKLVNKLVEE